MTPIKKNCFEQHQKRVLKKIKKNKITFKKSKDKCVPQISRNVGQLLCQREQVELEHQTNCQETIVFGVFCQVQQTEKGISSRFFGPFGFGFVFLLPRSFFHSHSSHSTVFFFLLLVPFRTFVVRCHLLRLNLFSLNAKLRFSQISEPVVSLFQDILLPRKWLNGTNKQKKQENKKKKLFFAHLAGNPRVTNKSTSHDTFLCPGGIRGTSSPGLQFWHPNINQQNAKKNNKYQKTKTYLVVFSLPNLDQ